MMKHVLQIAQREPKVLLLNFQKEKFEEQQKKLYSYKTKIEEYKDEKVNLNRKMQEMRVSSGTGLF
jgi:hypothetical protein